MTARTFVDYNILIYAHDADAGIRQRRASEELAELWAAGAGPLSTQVLQEFLRQRHSEDKNAPAEERGP
jgi:predicted nucleic acid-binding protein